jgi:DNA-binding NarL/FixJ family response regulator
MKPKIRVAVVEDKELLREQYAAVLNASAATTCCGVFPDGESALEQLPWLKPDVVLFDIQLPKLSGVQCVAQLKPQMPKTDFVMLTVYQDSKLIFQALENGASGYLLKRTTPNQLIRSIEEVHQGGAPMTTHIARMVVQSFRRQQAEDGALLEPLTPREEDVLQLVAKGLVNKEIADKLDISLETVRSYLKNVYSKLQVHSRTEAAMKYFR